MLKSGQTVEALSAIDQIVGTLKFPFGFYLPEIYRVRGECLAALGRRDDAIEQLRSAAELATSQGSELFALRAAIARARCCAHHAVEASAMADAQRSLELIGVSDWPEIVAAGTVFGQPQFTEKSPQSATMPKE